MTSVCGALNLCKVHAAGLLIENAHNSARELLHLSSRALRCQSSPPVNQNSLKMPNWESPGGAGPDKNKTQGSDNFLLHFSSRPPPQLNYENRSSATKHAFYTVPTFRPATFSTRSFIYTFYAALTK